MGKRAKNCQKIVVVAIIRDGEGRVLMQKRLDGKFPAANCKWEFPGGKVNFGETPEMALEREVAEEVGCEIGVGRLVPVVLSHTWDRTNGAKVHAVVLCYEAWFMDGTPTTEPGKTSEVCWFAPSEISQLERLDGVDVLLRIANGSA